MNILGIDFEEWFHPELIQNVLTTEKKSFRVVNGLDKILEFLENHDTYATFFMVGEILKEFPEILDKIIDNGHEIAFHTMYHSRLDSDGFREKFAKELEEFAKLTNYKSKGFRAPTFSLNEKSSWAIDLLEEQNYLYDSSIVPAKSYMYGNPNALKTPYKISSSSLGSNNLEAKITEFPLMVTKFLGKTIPAGGGFYLRTLPLSVTKKALRDYEKQKNPGVFYIHSWELTPEFMPKIKLSTKNNFITYHNLEKTIVRMDELLSNFSFTSFERYIQEKVIK
ncbi:polysaccharide deacetylase family protein [Nitrosopumilus sp.]|uniref:polysaccharide deacetylase family protein n=1 Tax=Nitrosopumilus sp. TaxID=2024843 RepID=UPI003D11596F